MALHGVSALQAKENGKPMGLSKGFNNCELFSVVSLLPQKAVTLLLFFLGGLWLRTKWHGSNGSNDFVPLFCIVVIRW